MELSAVVTEGLQLCGESARFGDRSYRKLVLTAFDVLLKRKNEDALTDDEDLTSVDNAVLKQAYAAMVTLILEAVKTNSDANDISSLLEDCKWTADRMESFNKIYVEQKPEVEAMLSRTGSSHPHIVDVDWRLDYYIKNNHMDKVNKPMYLITLKTEESLSPSGKDIQFSCSMEQLQDLVGKLKDACKTLEKTTHL